ncbi:hypothetical protein [Salinibacillus xinjiangensis]|uniref:Uncharacterized protein n=1 Tax=Salinibacillus xinjiangensis TaxID=1229268 RepID=A0A6G1X8U5_9BACI|nr:hypothetical protein [Salinibacillus xinjiangensis]MRG87325.1 hypothetical protein [Salinibacillus xinjiangensis]
MIYFIFELFFGAFEAFATLIISTTLFRIPIRSIYLRLLGVSFIISGMSLFLFNYLNVPYFLGEAINIGIIISFYLFFVHLRFWQSITVTMVGYVGANIILGITYLILSSFQLIEGNMIMNTPNGLLNLMTLQFIYSLISFHLTFVLYYFRWGFLFTLQPELQDRKLDYKNIQVISVIFLSLFTTLYVLHLGVYSDHIATSPITIIVVIAAGLLSLFTMFMLNRKRLQKEFLEIQQNIKL